VTPPLLECVPNVSEGRDPAVLAVLAEAVEAAGARLLDLHADVDHHRSVFTFVGQPAPVIEAALALARRAVERIDLRRHAGVHPRIGAVDVIPFVPLRNARMPDAVAAAHALGPRLARDLGVPVYYYGAAALMAGRQALPEIRRGGLEGLTAKMARPGGRPDVGPATPHPAAGATAVGARDLLIAFNAVLATAEVAVARAIARSLRESSGGLPAVRAIGVLLPSRGLAQVAMNLLDYRRTPLGAAMTATEAQAARHGVVVLEYELVGCAPENALAGADRSRIRMVASQILATDLLDEPPAAT
jgi:glutamate formiminotransferase